MLKIACALLSISCLTLIAEARSIQVSCSPKIAFQTKSVKATLGKTITVTAPGNPTTGYRWISKDGLEGKYVSDADGMKVGVGGTYTFEIEVTPQTLGKTFAFVYARPWMLPAAEARCRITVKEIFELSAQ